MKIMFRTLINCLLLLTPAMSVNYTKDDACTIMKGLKSFGVVKVCDDLGFSACKAIIKHNNNEAFSCDLVCKEVSLTCSAAWKVEATWATYEGTKKDCPKDGEGEVTLLATSKSCEVSNSDNKYCECQNIRDKDISVYDYLLIIVFITFPVITLICFTLSCWTLRTGKLAEIEAEEDAHVARLVKVADDSGLKKDIEPNEVRSAEMTTLVK